MIFRARRRGVVVLAVLVGFSVTSCSTAAHGTAPPERAAASRGVAPTTVAAGVRPALAGEHTGEGARALAVHYMHARNQAFTAPDPLLLSGLHTDECGACGRDVRAARELREHHLRYGSAPFTLLAAAPRRGPSVDTVVVEVTVQRVAASVLHRDGSVTSTAVPARLVQHVELRWTPDGWYVHTVRDQ